MTVCFSACYVRLAILSEHAPYIYICRVGRYGISIYRSPSSRHPRRLAPTHLIVSAELRTHSKGTAAYRSQCLHNPRFLLIIVSSDLHQHQPHYGHNTVDSCTAYLCCIYPPHNNGLTPQYRGISATTPQAIISVPLFHLFQKCSLCYKNRSAM